MNQDQQNEEVCSICLSRDLRKVPYLEDDFSNFPSTINPFTKLKIMVCENCGFGWGTPPIEDIQLESFYTNVYRKHPAYSNKQLKNAYGFRKQNSKVPNFRPPDARTTSQLTLAKLFKAFEPGMSFLDIGSGGGASFQTIFQLVSSVNCFAFEPDVESRKFLQEKLKVHVYPYAFQHKPRQTTSASSGNSKFDFILMSHVLEHFNGKDIVAVLKNVRSLLSKDGIFVCEVPHCDFRGSHEYMRTNDTPHISFFGKDSLTLSLEQAGLKTLFLNTCGEEYDQWWEKHKQVPNLKTKAYKIAKIISTTASFFVDI